MTSAYVMWDVALLQNDQRTSIFPRQYEESLHADFWENIFNADDLHVLEQAVYSMSPEEFGEQVIMNSS